MRITLQIGDTGSAERRADAVIGRGEIADVRFHFAHAGARNRTLAYLRRHPLPGGPPVDPDRPVRDPGDPPKLPLPDHLAALRAAGTVPAPAPDPGGGNFATEPVMLAVPISDVAANPLRPAFHRVGLGATRVFHLAGEPIAGREYFCALRFAGGPGLELRWVRFDAAADTVTADGRDLAAAGLEWAAALVPLVEGGRPLAPAAIARRDYDLRQLVGRDAGGDIRYAYEGFPDAWDARVDALIAAHAQAGRPWATFYHSALAVDAAGNVFVRQVEDTLPGLAAGLAADGMAAAGLLDSGGSCALYDPWLGFLNHGWYYRPPRGATLVFVLKAAQRLAGARRE